MKVNWTHSKNVISIHSKVDTRQEPRVQDKLRQARTQIMWQEFSAKKSKGPIIHSGSNWNDVNSISVAIFGFVI